MVLPVNRKRNIRQRSWFGKLRKFVMTVVEEEKRRLVKWLK